MFVNRSEDSFISDSRRDKNKLILYNQIHISENLFFMINLFSINYWEEKTRLEGRRKSDVTDDFHMIPFVNLINQETKLILVTSFLFPFFKGKEISKLRKKGAILDWFQ